MTEAVIYKIEISYIGTEFSGWQTQPGYTAVQDHLNKALKTFLRHDVKSIGSARTDSGVHAEQQVVMFSSSVSFDSRSFVRGINALLPPAIGVRSVTAIQDDFHAIRSSTGKLYRYSLYTGNGKVPFFDPYVWRVHGLDVDLLKSIIPQFAGDRDFSSFCAKDTSAKTFQRRVNELTCFKQGDFLHIYVLGEGFLKQMVRNIVGTAVDMALGKIPSTSLEDIFEAKDRQAAGRTAPAKGLSLVKVFYNELPSDLHHLIKEQIHFPLTQA